MQDFVYDLTEDEVKKLTNNSIKQVPVQTFPIQEYRCYSLDTPFPLFCVILDIGCLLYTSRVQGRQIENPLISKNHKRKRGSDSSSDCTLTIEGADTS